jgi:hypothetical protein
MAGLGVLTGILADIFGIEDAMGSFLYPYVKALALTFFSRERNFFQKPVKTLAFLKKNR